MSLNLGTTVVRAAANLRGNPDWEALRLGLGEVVNQKIDQALSSPIEHRVEQTAYARAVRDVWQALEAATREVRITPALQPKRGAVAAGAAAVAAIDGAMAS